VLDLTDSESEEVKWQLHSIDLPHSFSLFDSVIARQCQ